MNRTRTFAAFDKDGNRYTWKFWRDAGYWFLQGPDSYMWTLEPNWLDSVPRIQGILENHGLTAAIS